MMFIATNQRRIIVKSLVGMAFIAGWIGRAQFTRRVSKSQKEKINEWARMEP
jgi:hypothetical protein